jgi:allophanate hydrolase subunit 1
LDAAEYPTWRTVFRLLADFANDRQLIAEHSAGYFFVSAAGFGPDMAHLLASTPALHGWTLDDLYW